MEIILIYPTYPTLSNLMLILILVSQPTVEENCHLKENWESKDFASFNHLIFASFNQWSFDQHQKLIFDSGAHNFAIILKAAIIALLRNDVFSLSQQQLLSIFRGYNAPIVHIVEGFL